MEAGRVALLADIDAWSRAGRTLGDVLTANATEILKGRDMIEEGACLSDVIATLSTTTRFVRMNEALADFEMARFALRSSLINAALAEGLTPERLVELLEVPPEMTVQVLDVLASEEPYV